MLQITDHLDRGLTFAEGFSAGAIRSGLKTAGDDISLILAEVPSAVAGVFTTNQVKAASVTYSSTVTRGGMAQAIICNAGNANACNGTQGDIDANTMAVAAANAIGIPHDQMIIAQTGIIGHPMPMKIVTDAIVSLPAAMGHGAEIDMQVARAMMTTDLVPKLIGSEFLSDHVSGTFKIGGCCKGSGMIAPNMATMLCFITTDVEISARDLQIALSGAVRTTFNRMTVDGDTSTNDMVIVLANGKSRTKINTPEALVDFTSALEHICLHLAKAVARDGEGATKLVKVNVNGAKSESDADKIARTIAESPLVKTALYGNDPNWGRIMMAAGRANIPFDFNLVDVFLGGIQVFKAGIVVNFDPEEASMYLNQATVELTVELNAGGHNVTFYTCDFSYDYVKINAEYHT